MKRLFSGFLCVLFTAFLLSACQDTLPSDPFAASTDPTVTITVLAGQSTSDAGLEDMIDKKVSSVLPEVQLEWESVDWGAYFGPQMQARLASGEVPDIMIGKAQDVATYYPSRFLAAWPQELGERIRPEVLTHVTFDGQLYGAPFNALYQGVLYNKNIFYRYNLQIPQTTEQLTQIVEKLQQVGVTPFATHFQENWFIGNVTMQFAANQVFLQEPHWGDRFRAGEYSFSNSQAFQECLRQVQYLLDNSWENALVTSQPECDLRFIKEEAAMYVTGSWSFQTIQSLAPAMPIGIFPYPNEDGTAGLIYEPNITFMKSAITPYEEYIDQIVLSIFEDDQLAESIYDFTQTASTLRSVPSKYPKLIEDDIEEYNRLGKVTDVTTGNTQLVWNFQDALAAQACNWLEGKLDFEDVLHYADTNRIDSAQSE